MSTRINKCIEEARKRGGLSSEELAEFKAELITQSKLAQKSAKKAGLDKETTDTKIAQIQTLMADKKRQDYKAEYNKITDLINQHPEKASKLEQAKALRAEKQKARVEAEKLAKLRVKPVKTQPFTKPKGEKVDELPHQAKKMMDATITEAVIEQQKNKDGNKTGFPPKPYQPTKADIKFAEETPYIPELVELENRKKNAVKVDPKKVQHIRYGGTKEYKIAHTPKTATRDSEPVPLSAKQYEANRQIEEAARAGNPPRVNYRSLNADEQILIDVKNKIAGLRRYKQIPESTIPKLFDKFLTAAITEAKGIADTKAPISYETKEKEYNDRQIIVAMEQKARIEKLFKEEPYIRLTQKEIQDKLDKGGFDALSENEQNDYFYYKNLREAREDLPKDSEYSNEKSEKQPETQAELEERIEKIRNTGYESAGTIIKAGKRLAASEFPDKAALLRLPREEQLNTGEDVIGPYVLTGLAKKGFIKAVPWKDGTERWVPLDYKTGKEVSEKPTNSFGALKKRKKKSKSEIQEEKFQRLLELEKKTSRAAVLARREVEIDSDSKTSQKSASKRKTSSNTKKKSKATKQENLSLNQVFKDQEWTEQPGDMVTGSKGSKRPYRSMSAAKGQLTRYINSVVNKNKALKDRAAKEKAKDALRNLWILARHKDGYVIRKKLVQENLVNKSKLGAKKKFREKFGDDYSSQLTPQSVAAAVSQLGGDTNTERDGFKGRDFYKNLENNITIVTGREALDVIKPGKVNPDKMSQAEIDAEIARIAAGQPGTKLSTFKGKKVGGFYLDGKIYLIRENLKTEKDVIAVFLHEGGHLLVDKDKNFQILYKGIINSLRKKLKTDAKLKAIRSKVEDSYLAEDWDEETLMHYVQDQANVNQPWYKEIISRIKIWLAKTFKTNFGLTGYEIGLIIRHSVQRRLNQKITSSTGRTAKLTYGSSGALIQPITSLAEAKQMVKDGKTRKYIRDNTGWFQPTQDGIWRFEIDDDSSTIKPSMVSDHKNYGSVIRDKGFTNVSNILAHDTLYESYPWIKDIPVSVNVADGLESWGETTPSIKDPKKKLTPGNYNFEIAIKADNIEEAHRTLLHEIQHTIQMQEGLSRGGTTELKMLLTPKEAKAYRDAKRYNEETTRAVKQKLYSLKDKLDAEDFERALTIDELAELAYQQQIQAKFENPKWRHERYKKLTGEQEARDVAERFKKADKGIPKLIQANVVSLVSEDSAQRILTKHTTPNVKYSISDEAAHVYEDSIESSSETAKEMAEQLRPFMTKDRQDTTFWERLFGSSEYTLRKDAASRRVYEAAATEEYRRHRLEQFITGNYLEYQLQIQRERGKTFFNSAFTGRSHKKFMKAMEKKVGKYLFDTDASGKGFRARAVTKETSLKVDGVPVAFEVTHYEVILRNGKKLKRKFETARAARKVAHALEQKYLKDTLKFNAAERGWVQEARNLTDRAFYILRKDMIQTLEYAKKHKIKIPPKRIKTEDGKIKSISLEQAIIELGNLQGTYMPRERPKTKYRVKSVKGDKIDYRNFAAHWVEKETAFGWTNKIRRGVNKLSPAERYAKAMEKAGWKSTIEEIKTPTEAVFNVPRLLASMDAILGHAAKEGQRVSTEESEKALQDMFQQITTGITQLYATRTTFVSRARRQTELYTGYEREELNRVLASYSQRTAAAEARRQTARDMTLAFTGRDKSFNDWVRDKGIPDEEATEANYREFAKSRAIDPVKQKQLWEDTQLFMEHFLKPNGKLATAIGFFKTLAVVKYLGWRVSSAAVNMTNMATGVIGTMSAKTDIGILDSWKLVGHAADSYFNYRLELMKNTGKAQKTKSGRVTDFERKVYGYITRNGWDSPLYNYEAAAAMQNTGSRVFNGVTKTAMAMFGQTEKANRAMTIKAAFDAITKSKNPKYQRWYKTFKEAKTDKEQGQAFKLMMDEAKRISDDAHGSYGKAAKPWLIQKYKILDAPYTFMKFSHNYMLNMYNIGFNDRQVKEALYLLMAPGFLAGASASLATPALNFIFSKFMDDDPEEEFYKFVERQLGSDTFARFGLIGALTGVSFRGSLEANIPKFKKPMDLLGAPGSVATDIHDAWDHWRYGEGRKGLEALLPSAAGNIVKGNREAEEGLTLQGYGPKFFGKDQIGITPYEFVLRYLSLSPVRLATISDKQWSEKQVRATFEKRRKAILRRYKKYYMTPYHLRSSDHLIKLENTRNFYNEQVNTMDRNTLIPYATDKWLTRNLKAAFKPDKYERNR